MEENMAQRLSKIERRLESLETVVSHFDLLQNRLLFIKKGNNGVRFNSTDLVRDDVLQTCVTPSRIEGVRVVLEKEDTPYRCAVKLLPLFFSKDELSRGNTDGSRKLNLLKLLVFEKFPVESDKEKEK
ncbi:hypothetical protein P5673_028562, partial [Acropora cervicornis]